MIKNYRKVYELFGLVKFVRVPTKLSYRMVYSFLVFFLLLSFLHEFPYFCETQMITLGRFL